MKEQFEELKKQFKESKEREAALNLLLTKDNESANYKAKSHPKKIKYHEIGKNKVKIPELDLSVIHRSEDSQDMKESADENSSPGVAKPQLSES